MGTPNKTVVKRLERNVLGEDYVVGDIHGCFKTLEAALQQIGFNAEKDRLLSVGDLVNRGPRSHEVLRWLNAAWFHPVMGNHEVKVLQHMHALGLGELTKEQMIESIHLGTYKKKQMDSWLNMVEPSEDIVNIFHAFNGLPMAIEVDTPLGLVGVLHGDILHIDWGLFKQDLMSDGYQGLTGRNCLNGRNRKTLGIKMPVLGVFAVYVGHSRVVKPELYGNVVYIDSCCAYGKKLTLVRLSDHAQFMIDYCD